MLFMLSQNFFAKYPETNRLTRTVSLLNIERKKYSRVYEYKRCARIFLTLPTLLIFAKPIGDLIIEAQNFQIHNRADS